MNPSQNIQHYLSQPLVVGQELNGHRVRLLTRVNGTVVRERSVVVSGGIVQPVASDIPELPDGGTVFMSVDSAPVQPDRIEQLKNSMTIIRSVAQQMRQSTEITDRMLEDLDGAVRDSLLFVAALSTK